MKSIASRMLSAIPTLAACLALSVIDAPQALADTANPTEPEESDVAAITPPKPGWIFVNRGFVFPGTAIYDTGSGKMMGLVQTALLADMAIDPAGKFYYVAETIWSKGNRGTRQDMVTVYDSTNLKLQAEIPIPGRLLIGGRKQDFILSDDGKLGFVYNFSPASSVSVVDLEKRKFLRAIELPGCASLIPNPGAGFSALCADGSLATVTAGAAKPAITHSAPFFSATDDPIFDNLIYDKTKQQALFLSYTGKIYTAKMAAAPTVSEPFSIQVAAGLRAGDTKPLDVNWYPGGGQPMALHRASGHLFVLMHPGEYWTHKAGGTEIWDVDLAAKKVVKRVPITDPATTIEVTQEAAPKLMYSGGEGGTVHVVDVKTWDETLKLDRAGSGVITVVEAR